MVAVPKNPLTVQYLCHAYAVPYPTFKRWIADAFQSSEYVQVHKGKTVLTCPKLAAQVYNMRRIFATTIWRDTMTERERIPYAKKASDHLAKQSVMKDAVVSSLQKDKGEIVRAPMLVWPKIPATGAHSRRSTTG